MKKNLFIINVTLGLLLIWSCSDNETDSDTGFSVNPLVIPAAASAGDYSFTVEAPGDWEAELNFETDYGGWCTLHTVSGSGKGEINVSVNANLTFKARTASLKVRSENMVRHNKVLQRYLELGPNEVMINGVIWATCNVGEPNQFTPSPDIQGLLYQFNRKVGYPATGQEAPANWPTTYTNEETDWQPENSPCPEGWRLPTTEELQGAWNIGATWRPASQTGYAIDGVIIGIAPNIAATATKNDMKGGIFLPKSGWRLETGVLDRDWLCAVSSGTQDASLAGRVMPHRDAGSYNCATCGSIKPWAVAVRCVKDIQ